MLETEFQETFSQLVLVGCGGFAVEVSQYISDINSHSTPEGHVYVVSDILASGLERFEDICGQIGSRPNSCVDLAEISDFESKEFVICIGDPTARWRVYRQLEQRQAKFASIIHPTSYVAQSATIGRGSIIAPFCFVGPFATVEDNCVLNVRSTVGHDAKLGCSTVLSPHVDLNGGTSCGEITFVGAGVVVDPKIHIGSYCKISSGAVVKHDTPDGFLMAGNPAKGRQMYKKPE